ncbi:CAP domain-containing protein [Chelativorans intermedius]|uniref:CAP domain-containing protein n=1 Tax=Chelativorans intermedius TaxID=515947 RepID=A0ABV6D6E4_9HYPH|nr:CAP domain-containing protein [Chelativorans intermedius]
MIRWTAIAGPGRAACLMLLVIACTACAAARPDRPLEPVGDLQSLRRSALALVNGERARHGLPALRATAPITAAAQAHAEDMARRDFYDHRSPEGRDVADRYRAHGGGLWAIVAENIASCIACQIPREQLRTFHARWMESPGHRRNILDPRLQDFGFGIAAAGGRLYAVQAFVTERRDAYTMPPPVPRAAGRSSATFRR